MGALRFSEGIPRTHGGDRMRVAREIVLETLALAPSSFAALYGTASRFSKRRLGVRAFAALVDQLADVKRIRLWMLDGTRYVHATGLDCAHARRGYVAWLDPLPLEQLTVDDLAYDHVGLWLTLKSTSP